jgi:hypothetical protein
MAKMVVEGKGEVKLAGRHGDKVKQRSMLNDWLTDLWTVMYVAIQ